MSSNIWPPPTEAEQAQLDDFVNPLEVCGDCGTNPCTCADYCDECESNPCECDTCDICGCVDCECYEVYVKYTTTVTVQVDSEGDVCYVGVNSDLGDPDDVVDEGDCRVSRALRERALEAVQTQEWPSWDIA